jgi:uncharacterized membrane protein YdjX (TVP38/TMEM64 family)
MNPTLRLVGRPLLLLLGLLVAGLALRALPGLEAVSVGHGAAGPLLFLGLAAVLCAVGMPRQAAAFAGGAAFGFWPGLVLAMLAQVLACAADFLWARAVGRGWARRRLARGGRLARLDAALAAQPFAATLTLRLLPVGNNLLLNLLAGVSGVPAAAFLLASALGYLPQSVVFALLGGGVRVGRPAQIALGVALFAASVALGLVLLRRWRAGAAAAGPAISSGA